MKKLLNFSTHPGDPEMFGDDWSEVAAFLNLHQFDGFELYPVGGYPFEKIPGRLIQGLHLRFFIFLREIWQGDEKGLLALFDNWENVVHFYGGRTGEAVIAAYVSQLNLAASLDCEYVVFHPVHCDLAHIYDWNFPYHWRDTFDLCGELLNEALPKSNFRGQLLFENLWWPGSFTLETPEQYEYLRSRVNYDRCGIALDTGHMLCSLGGFDEESEAIRQLLKKMRSLGELCREVKTVHLSMGLSGGYIKSTRSGGQEDLQSIPFWERFQLARKHVSQIDPHLPFTHPEIGKIFDLVEPDNLVFEFTFTNLGIWQGKIRQQKEILNSRLWP